VSSLRLLDAFVGHIGILKAWFRYKSLPKDEKSAKHVSKIYLTVTPGIRVGGIWKRMF
jgi:hypothetical protein